MTGSLAAEWPWYRRRSRRWSRYFNGAGRRRCDSRVNYRRDSEAAEETVAAIVAAGGKAQAYSASVDDYEQNAEMVAAIEADHGAIGILVNNAVSPVAAKAWNKRIQRSCNGLSPLTRSAPLPKQVSDPKMRTWIGAISS